MKMSYEDTLRAEIIYLRAQLESANAGWDYMLKAYRALKDTTAQGAINEAKS